MPYVNEAPTTRAAMKTKNDEDDFFGLANQANPDVKFVSDVRSQKSHKSTVSKKSMGASPFSKNVSNTKKN